MERDLIILQRAINEVPDRSKHEDWRLPLIIEQYENSNVNIYLNELLFQAFYNIFHFWCRVFHIPFSFL